MPFYYLSITHSPPPFTGEGAEGGRGGRFQILLLFKISDTRSMSLQQCCLRFVSGLSGKATQNKVWLNACCA
ncbi:hypothetical protein HPSD74_0003 [Glaesserella parasuis D74]|nr:hypothetical protein HPSD74_0003 [Glaesserella parasuis D74]